MFLIENIPFHTELSGMPAIIRQQHPMKVNQDGHSLEPDRRADVKKLEAKANPHDPIHQLILWRIHGWQSGETNRRDRPILGLNVM